MRGDALTQAAAGLIHALQLLQPEVSAYFDMIKSGVVTISLCRIPSQYVPLIMRLRG